MRVVVGHGCQQMVQHGFFPWAENRRFEKRIFSSRSVHVLPCRQDAIICPSGGQQVSSCCSSENSPAHFLIRGWRTTFSLFADREADIIRFTFPGFNAHEKTSTGHRSHGPGNHKNRIVSPVTRCTPRGRLHQGFPYPCRKGTPVWEKLPG